MRRNSSGKEDPPKGVPFLKLNLIKGVLTWMQM